ncbi:PREDICTED: major facilitator superfamily domain-containing protein 6-like [Tinamus guttatus]|uniref:major facilitator superfamily domain-containing protein 6-like n=1 Tax=Tinamus guttatus TaxID=94827 RepID=UPI00052EF646|nr:PREDICTED: major facilitator superfamily domain-containing protein 6-like [Tinamus guttatus]
MLMTPALRGASSTTEALWKSDAGAGDMGTDRYAAGSVNAEAPALGMPYRATLLGRQEETSSTATAVAGVDLDDNPEKRFPLSQNSKLPLFKSPLPTVGGAGAPANLSHRWRVALDFTLDVVQSAEGQRWVFLMALGAVLLWELLAAPVERTVDESLFEYLDFVDAADRYGTLWVWGYLGVSVGACGVTVIVDQLGCHLGSRLSRLAVHFYAYALLAVLSLLANAFLPTYAAKKAKRMSRTAKALALIGGDGRAVLAAVNAVLAGAAGSAAHNFLFWQMEDQGSGESYMGLWVAVGLVAELALYPLRGELLRMLPGSGAVALGLGCQAAQLLCYSFGWAAWTALLAQLLSAFSNGALWWALESTMDDVATPGMERALRALLRGLAQGAGAALGSLAGGLVVDSFGLAVLYRACSAGLLLWLCLFLTLQSRLPRQKKINYSHLLAADSSDASDSEEEKERDWLGKAMKDDSFGRNW